MDGIPKTKFLTRMQSIKQSWNQRHYYSINQEVKQFINKTYKSKMSLTPYVASGSNPFFADVFGENWQIQDPFANRLFPGFRSRNNELTKPLAPLLSCDLVETEDSFKVMADLPGVDPSDLELTIEGNRLMMKAERKHKHEVNTDHVHSMERSYGSVQRSFRLPKNADLDNAKTTFKNGELIVVIPKLAQLPPTSWKLAINQE